MLYRLEFKNFKSFREAGFDLGRITALVGVNASGKSNIRDAFKFLRGLSLFRDPLEIINPKTVTDGAIWSGIRGGLTEISFKKSDTFSIICYVNLADMEPFSNPKLSFSYKINFSDYTIKENDQTIFLEDNDSITKVGIDYLVNSIKLTDILYVKAPIEELINAVGNIKDDELKSFENFEEYRMKSSAFITYFKTVQSFENIRLIDLDPNLMRQPSRVTQNVLDERGGNLASVLRHIILDLDKQQTLIRWVEELTNIELKELSFDVDRSGLVTLLLTGEDDTTISAYSASDGTLRFLGLLASLITAERGSILFFEEIDNGIHPSKVRLLISMIDKFCSDSKIKVVFTTHSPEVLNWLPKFEDISLNIVFRDPEDKSSRVVDVKSIPEYDSVSEKFDLGKLHEMGWFEDAIFSGDVH